MPCWSLGRARPSAPIWQPSFTEETLCVKPAPCCTSSLGNARHQDLSSTAPPSLPLAQLSPRRATLQPEFGRQRVIFLSDQLWEAANSQVSNLFPLFALGLSVSIPGSGSASISTSSSAWLTMVSSLGVSPGLYSLPESSGTKSLSESEQRNN